MQRTKSAVVGRRCGLSGFFMESIITRDAALGVEALGFFAMDCSAASAVGRLGASAVRLNVNGIAVDARG